LTTSLRGLAQCVLLWLLTGCGQVVAIKLPGQDPNPNGYYVCEPAGGVSFDCKSHREFHQYDRELDAGKECSFGVANVYVETNWHGNVSRIQYVCSTPPVAGFPAVPAAPVAPAVTPSPTSRLP
jgi:hypothetical protein